MSLEFLTPARGASAPAALSPFDPATSAAGATFATRDGWRVPTRFSHPSDEGRTIAATVTTKPFYDPEGAVLRS